MHLGSKAPKPRETGGAPPMEDTTGTNSRKLLKRLRGTLAEDSAGQARLDKITHLIADSMGTEVCSIYLFRDKSTLELCATEGLHADAVHKTRLRLGEGLVGRVAARKNTINAANAPATKGFRFMPETGEEIYSSFLGVPIQRLGSGLGVLVVQSKTAREFSVASHCLLKHFGEVTDSFTSCALLEREIAYAASELGIKEVIAVSSSVKNRSGYIDCIIDLPGEVKDMLVTGMDERFQGDVLTTDDGIRILGQKKESESKADILLLAVMSLRRISEGVPAFVKYL